MSALYFRIEPLNRAPAPGGSFVCVWPEPNGDGKHTHNSHPDRQVIDSAAGDTLVVHGRRYRMLAVQRFGDWKGESFNSVAECVATS